VDAKFAFRTFRESSKFRRNLVSTLLLDQGLSNTGEEGVQQQDRPAVPVRDEEQRQAEQPRSHRYIHPTLLEKVCKFRYL
jgi:hypothetical protein